MARTDAGSVNRRTFLKGTTALAATLAANAGIAAAQQPNKTSSDSQIRRVVTGKDSAGKAVVQFDGVAANVQSRAELGTTNSVFWVTDSTPPVISSNADAGNRKVGVEPPPNGTIFRVIEYAPQKDIHSDYETKLRTMRAMGLAPEGSAREHPRDPGMHQTRSLDYILILSGEIDMLLDDSEVHLKAGDVVVQQGTNHAWVNRGSQPCKVAFVLISARGQ
jgi:mannose-6-phosphate isomerase-like protein (cupin superfamily)